VKAVICGAGLTGLALAQRLGTLGWDVVVLEKAPGPRAQRVARAMANWFLPESLLRLQARRMTLRVAGLPGFGQYVATSLVGKPTTMIRDLGASRDR